MSIAVSHLHKSYGKQQVLNDLSFSINSGEIVGFLGNNGAGKSTTMKIITGRMFLQIVRFVFALLIMIFVKP